MPVDLGLTPDGRWDVQPPELLVAARDAGFAAVGVAAGQAVSAAAAFKSTGLRCHELLALVITDDHDRTESFAAKLAEAAATVGAEWVLTVFQSGLGSESAASIRRCAAMLAEADTKMAVEFSPLGAVPTISAGLEVLAAVGAERAGLVIDSWHFCLGASTWADLASVPLEQIAYVQFSDALAPSSDPLMEQTLHRRALPGEGVLELDRFASTLLGRGWEGLVSIEVLNRDLRELRIEEFARRAARAYAGYWC